MTPWHHHLCYATLVGFPKAAIADAHAEVVLIANKPIEEVVDRLWRVTSKQKIDRYYEVLGLL